MKGAWEVERVHLAQHWNGRLCLYIPYSIALDAVPDTLTLELPPCLANLLHKRVR